MNKITKILFLLFFLSIVYSSVDSNISYDLRYADAKEESSDYSEHVFDVSLFFKDIYFFTRVQYKDPALLGPKTKSVSDAFNLFYIEVSKPNFDFTIGNLYSMYGRGLSLHTYENRDINYDNSLLGIESVYHLRDNIDIFSLFGKKNIKSRLRPDEMNPSISIKNTLGSIGISTFFDYFNLHYLSMVYDQDYDVRTIESLSKLDNVLGKYLDERFNYTNAPEPIQHEMRNVEHNIGVEFLFVDLSIYFEKSLVFYNKILDKRVSGYRDYMSMYIDLYGFNILYEYKNYNTPYLYNVFCNGPTGFRESTSTLASRNIHNIDFSNEYGHQVEVIKSFDNGMNFIFNYAFSYRHKKTGSDPNVFESFEYLLDIDKLNLQESFLPYRQVYLEFSGWNYRDNFYYKIGMDHYYEILKSDIEDLGTSAYLLQYIETKTLPMQYTYKFSSGKSISSYVEYQDKYDYARDENYEFIFLSPSYSHQGYWVLTLFLEKGKYAPFYEEKTWEGIDFTINIKNSNQLSLFYGSQVGGLICANGSCVLQPDFEDGFKVSFKTSF